MTFLRRLAEYEPDDTDERLQGLQLDTLDELRAERLARQDREDDHCPANGRHLDDTTPTFTDQAPRHLPPGGAPTLTGANLIRGRRT